MLQENITRFVKRCCKPAGHYFPALPQQFRSVLLVFSLVSGAALISALGINWWTRNRPPSPEERHDLNVLRTRLVRAWLEIEADKEAELLATAHDLLEKQAVDGSWPDVDYRSNDAADWETVQHLVNATILAQAWKTEQEDSSGELLRNGAIAALDYWVQHDFTNENWWYNRIWVPKLIGTAFLLLDHENVQPLIGQAEKVFQRCRWWRMTGQNRVWIAGNYILWGCLLEKPGLVQMAYQNLSELLCFAGEAEEGIQRDGSFHQHGPLLYSGAYGAAFSRDIGRYVTCALGTSFSVDEARLDALLALLLDGQQWMMVGGSFDYSTIGREITRARIPRPSHRPSLFLNNSFPVTLKLLAGMNLPRANELDSYYCRLTEDDHCPPLLGNRYFWRSDYMVHRSSHAVFSIRMHSNRTLNAEYVNGEGGTTHHLADGCTFIYQHGQEYKNVFPVWDWQRLPGTTTEIRPQLLPPTEGLPTLGTTSWVGGVSDGKIGLAFMDFQREGLRAHKAWYCAGESLTCLGTGISCNSSNQVITTVNQCRLLGPVLINGLVSGRTGEFQHLLTPATVWHDGILYSFPASQDLTIYHGPQNGNWANIGAGPDKEVTENVFLASLSHGANPNGATYTYQIRGSVEPWQLPDVLASPDLQVSPDSLGFTSGERRSHGFAFLRPDSMAAGDMLVSANKPCLALLVESATGVTLTASNPANLPMNVSFHIHRQPSSVMSGVNRVDQPTTISATIPLPHGELAGSSVIGFFRWNENQD